jgi:hypothetical protein
MDGRSDCKGRHSGFVNVPKTKMILCVCLYKASKNISSGYSILSSCIIAENMVSNTQSLNHKPYPITFSD